MATYKRIDGDYVITTINSSDSVQLVTNEVDVTGNLTVLGRITAGNVSIGNITANYITANYITGTLLTANQSYITTVGNLNNLTVLGNVTSSTVTSLTVTGTRLVGPLTTNAQPNITSVGTLTSLAVTGSANIGGNANITGNAYLAGSSTIIGNVGVSGFYFGDGRYLANVVANVGATSRVANGVSQIDIPIANANIFFSVAGTSNVVVVRTSGIDVLGSVQGNLIGNVYAQNSALLINSTNSTHYGNFVGPLTGSVIAANATVIDGTTGVISTLANISSGSRITAAGNITGSYFLGNGSQLTGIDATSIQFGTSNVKVVSSGGNVATSVNGNANILVVTGTGANITGTLGVTGNITSGNISGTTHTGANATLTGTVTAATVNAAAIGNAGAALTGTLQTASQTNITSVGTLGSLTVTNTITGGNLSTGGTLTVSGTGQSSIAGNLNMNTKNITSLATPVNSADAATKQYVDDLAQGLNIHDSCNAATSATLATISGGTVTYNNGTAGVGATLTTTGSYTTIDGVTLSNGMRILVKNEVATANNGIYVRTSATVLTRADDFDTPAEMEGGDFTFVTAGTLYDSTGWVMADAVTTVGTSPIVFTQFSGAGTYTAGTGLTLTGTTFSVNASQTQITSVGTLTGLTLSGTLTGTTINAAAIGNSGATLTGTLQTAAQTNITSVGTITGGTWNSAIGSSATFAAGLSGANLASITGANVTGTVASATSATSATTAGTVTTAAQANITSVGTLTGLTINNATTAITNGGANGAGNIGSSSSYFNTVFATSTAALYADLAELYTADAEYMPGTVVEFGGTQEITMCQVADSHRVAGVVSENPAYVMNSGLSSEHVVKLALVGRVRCLVRGPVEAGDLLVSDTNGWARVNNFPAAGRIIGKSLERSDQDGYVEIVVGKH